jgi:hypothetical protein
MSERPQQTLRRPFPPEGMSLITPPRVCDDPEVQNFLNQYFLDFKPERAGMLTAHEVFRAARRKFGDLRCDSVKYFEH